MSPKRSSLASCATVALLFGAAAGCGGAYDRSDPSAAKDGDAPACEYEGRLRPDGETFPASDGCNTCHCDDGVVRCTERPCNSCTDIERRWSTALAGAKQCNPQGGAEVCAKLVLVGLGCPCETFVNPIQTIKLAALDRAEEEFRAADCFGPDACAACEPPGAATCSPDGECIDL